MTSNISAGQHVAFLCGNPNYPANNVLIEEIKNQSIKALLLWELK